MNFKQANSHILKFECTQGFPNAGLGIQTGVKSIIDQPFTFRMI